MSTGTSSKAGFCLPVADNILEKLLDQVDVGHNHPATAAIAVRICIHFAPSVLTIACSQADPLHLCPWVSVMRGLSALTTHPSFVPSASNLTYRSHKSPTTCSIVSISQCQGTGIAPHLATRETADWNDHRERVEKRNNDVWGLKQATRVPKC